MKKKLFLAAVALVALASCTSDEFVGENTSPKTSSNSDDAISFNLNVPKVTRADQTGSTAATTLGNTFYVYGIKTEKEDGAGNVGGTHTVFKNYVVKYLTNTAYTTTSNTKDWEYVGQTLTSKEQANITANDGSTGTQTIKYWDYSAPDYTFYAFSAKSGDIENDKISIVKNQTVTSSVYDNGYTVTLNGADINNLFFSERVNIVQSSGEDRTAVNTYGGNVTFRFHNAASKVRVAMYETIDGYSVTINKFSVDNDGADPAFSAMTDEVTANFAANLTNSLGTDAGTLTVTYYDDAINATENHPILSYSQTSGANKVLALGTNLKANTKLATTISAPTYDTADDASTTSVDENGAYTSVFPNIANTQNLKLKMTYTLTAPGTGETITVKDATAEIPAEYLRWKPGFAYTYIFKISANTNGSSGQGVVGLYPITFDAMATVTEDGLAEYITTVSEPSITTFGVKNNKYTTGKNEYEEGSDIYVAFVDGSKVVDDLTLGTNVNVYLAQTENATLYPITEASVAESIAEISSGTKKINVTDMNSDASTCFTTAPAKATVVPGEDGVNISVEVTLSGADAPADWSGNYYTDKACTTVATTYGAGTYYKKFSSALKLTGVKATTATSPADKAIVVEYIKTAATYHTSGAVYTLADESAFNTEVSTNGKLYTNTDGTTELTWSVYNTDASSKAATYYRRTAVKTVGEYAYKVIRVVAAPSSSR